MEYTRFYIKNYKGISHLEFYLNETGNSNIYTFVGLNESGKTTILESLSLFYTYAKSSESEEILHPTDLKDWHKAIPRGSQDNFNSVIDIGADFVLSQEAKDSIAELIRSKGYSLDGDMPSKASRNIELHFKDSVFEKRVNKTYIHLRVKKGRAKSTFVMQGQAREDLWNDVWEIISKDLQPIIYYPNFAFEFPEKIYLSSHQDEDPEQKFYRRFVQDVLDALENDTNIEDHIINRVNSADDKHLNSLTSLINKMGRIIDDTLSRHNVFSRQLGSITTRVTMPRKDTKGFYIQIKIVDKDDTYDVRERSLGFRWLFTFVVLTQFRIRRLGGKAPIFLFDEPASNLHQSAQSRLLNSIEDLSSQNGSGVIYTTHSHHMINPLWLENAFIVKNRGQDQIDDRKFNSKMTDIEITRYRQFVATNPNQRDYFQPILDVLEYSPSNLESVKPVAILEGKFDYYTLKYIEKFEKLGDVAFLPGSSASSLDHIISLYLAWGRKFVVILDDDKEGKKQKTRYIKDFGVFLEDKIYTLGDIDMNFKGMTMEDVVDNKIEVQQSVFPDSKEYNKYTYNTAIQESILKGASLPFSTNSVANLKKIYDFSLSR